MIQMSLALASGHLSLMGKDAVQILLSYQPTEAQELPEACYRQLMHALNIPLHLYSSFHVPPDCLLPKLFFFMSNCPLHVSNPLPLSQVLTTLLHQALFLQLAPSHVHMHSQTETVAATTTVCNLPHTQARQCASASGLP